MNHFFLRVGLLPSMAFALAIQVFAEDKPYYTVYSAVCPDGALASYFGRIRLENTDESVAFPNEIDLQAGVNLLLTTDGNEQWTIMSLGVRRFGTQSLDEKKMDDPTFRDRLLKTSLLSMLFRDGKTRLFMRKGRLYLLSNNFPAERLDELNPELKWWSLPKNQSLAVLMENPEWTLYPDELPPKKDNEGRFLKNIRERRAAAGYVKDDATESTLVTVKRHAQGNLPGDWEMKWSTRFKDGTDQTRQIAKRLENKTPFGLAGFISGAESNAAFYRLFPGENAFGEKKLLIKGGLFPLGPADQEEGQPEKTRAIHLSYAITDKSLEKVQEENRKENWDVKGDGSLLVGTPLYSDEMKANPNFPSVETENKAFFHVQEGLLDLVKQIQVGVESCDPSRPADLGVVMDHDTITFMAALPPGGKIPDTLSVDDLIARINDYSKISHLIKGEADVPAVTLQRVTQEIETIDGMKYVAGQILMRSESEEKTEEIPVIAFLSAVKSNEFYALQCTTQGYDMMFNQKSSEPTDWKDVDELQERHYVSFKQAVEESLRGRRENAAAPESFIRLNGPNATARITEHFAEREWSYSAMVRQDSLALLAMLPSILGHDVFHNFLRQ